ncbi:MAG TPA: hypothetical protein PLD01_11415 [Mycobacterium sp.]|nr:hypothetical protein [Mycobacterium sp.]
MSDVPRKDSAAASLEEGNIELPAAPGAPGLKKVSAEPVKVDEEGTVRDRPNPDVADSLYEGLRMCPNGHTHSSSKSACNVCGQPLIAVGGAGIQIGPEVGSRYQPYTAQAATPPIVVGTTITLRDGKLATIARMSGDNVWLDVTEGDSSLGRFKFPYRQVAAAILGTEYLPPSVGTEFTLRNGWLVTVTKVTGAEVWLDAIKDGNWLGNYKFPLADVEAAIEEDRKGRRIPPK